MKIKIAIIIALLVASCQNKPSNELTTYSFGIVAEDSLYYINVNFENSDTVSGSTAHGIVIKFDNMFFDYNDSLVQFNKNQIIPKSIGTTKIKIRFPNKEIDSFKINISKLNGRFVLSKLLPA